jgi:hypothetical protein
VVGASAGDDVTLTAPVAATVPRDVVVGTVGLRVWPLDRLGSVSGRAAALAAR